MSAGAACASPPTSAAAKHACSGPTNAAHHAYVVVQHLSGSSLERCVGFTGSDIDGQAVMDQSGIQYLAHGVTAGKVVATPYDHWSYLRTVEDALGIGEHLNVSGSPITQPMTDVFG